MHQRVPPDGAFYVRPYSTSGRRALKLADDLTGFRFDEESYRIASQGFRLVQSGLRALEAAVEFHELCGIPLWYGHSPGAAPPKAPEFRSRHTSRSGALILRESSLVLIPQPISPSEPIHRTRQVR